MFHWGGKAPAFVTPGCGDEGREWKRDWSKALLDFSQYTHRINFHRNHSLNGSETPSENGHAKIHWQHLEKKRVVLVHLRDTVWEEDCSSPMHTKLRLPQHTHTHTHRDGWRIKLKTALKTALVKWLQWSPFSTVHFLSSSCGEHHCV